MTDIDNATEDARMEALVAEKVAAGMRVHNLKQASERVRRARNDLRLAADLIGESGKDVRLQDALIRVTVNDIENIAWKIETAIREGDK